MAAGDADVQSTSTTMAAYERTKDGSETTRKDRRRSEERDDVAEGIGKDKVSRASGG
jgi:hypothetical protein